MASHAHTCGALRMQTRGAAQEVVPDEGGSSEAGGSQKLRDAMVAATDAVRNVPNPLESANVEKLLPKVNIIKTARDLISLSLRGGE